jgi:DNA-binding GntR family transcriptional regulator
MPKGTPKVVDRESTSVRDRAYTHIQQKIASGVLAPGGAISELTIAKELRISRTPIREAIAQLVSEGLLTELNRGVIVASLTRQDILELYDLREALEVHAIQKAAHRPVPKPDGKLLQEMIDGLATLEKELKTSSRKVLTPEQMRQFVHYDLGFHRLLMRLALNSRILRVVNQTRLLISIFALERHGYTIAELQRIRSEHAKILDAILKQEPGVAASVLREHIKVSCAERLETYDQRERESSLREAFPF